MDINEDIKVTKVKYKNDIESRNKIVKLIIDCLLENNDLLGDFDNGTEHK